LVFSCPITADNSKFGAVSPALTDIPSSRIISYDLNQYRQHTAPA